MENLKSQRFHLLQELLNCHSNIYFWRYDSDCVLLESSCPYESIFDKFLAVMQYKDYMLRYSEEHTVVLDLGTSIGLNWLAAFECEDGKLTHIDMIGPVFTTEVSLDTINELWNYEPQSFPPASLEWKHRLLDALEDVPVVSPLLWDEYAIQLHYCATQDKIQVSDIARKHEEMLLVSKTAARHDRHKVWVTEQNLLRMIREGDLNYRDALNQSRMISSGVPVHAKDPLRQAKDSVIVSIAICTRAAIEGGLSPDQAYSLGDSYLQGVEDAKTTTDVGILHDTMLGDFVHRVHKHRTNPDLSKPIQLCCDYIETHTEDKLDLETIAQQVGYTEYYLSRKFKAETHVSLNNYVKISKIERAKYLLSNTEDSIQEIADRLNFCSRSHFGDVFRKIVGCSPTDYREQN